MIDSSFWGWSFIFWTFHIWYEVISKTRYIFSALFLFLCFSQVVTNFTFTSETSLIVLLLKCLPSNATKKLLVKFVEHRLVVAFSGSIRGVVQMGRFILLSVPISQQLLKLTSPYFFCFFKWPLNFDCTFPWQQSGGSEQLISPEGWKLFPYK